MHIIVQFWEGEDHDVDDVDKKDGEKIGWVRVVVGGYRELWSGAER